MKNLSVRIISGLLFASISISANAGNAFVLQILSNNVPPVSNDLSVFAKAYADTRAPGEDIFIGFNRADRGMGAGDGIDEMVPFSFKYPALSEITSATLELDITPKSSLIGTDALVFADLGDLTVGFGNDRLQSLRVNRRRLLRFNLLNIQKSFTDGTPIGVVDISPYLLDGDFDVIYLDDAIIHRATLRINGVAQKPVPPLFVE